MSHFIEWRPKHAILGEGTIRNVRYLDIFSGDDDDVDQPKLSQLASMERKEFFLVIYIKSSPKKVMICLDS